MCHVNMASRLHRNGTRRPQAGVFYDVRDSTYSYGTRGKGLNNCFVEQIDNSTFKKIFTQNEATPTRHDEITNERNV